jgi:cytochrome c5
MFVRDILLERIDCNKKEICVRKTALNLVLIGSFFLNSYAADADLKKGEDIYNQYCSVCHMSGVAQAPKAHDQAAWQARYDAAFAKVKQGNPNASADDLKKLTYEQLASSVMTGLNAMPPGGTCPNTTCKNKDDYISAIQFMMSPEK